MERGKRMNGREGRLGCGRGLRLIQRQQTIQPMIFTARLCATCRADARKSIVPARTSTTSYHRVDHPRNPETNDDEKNNTMNVEEKLATFSITETTPEDEEHVVQPSPRSSLAVPLAPSRRPSYADLVAQEAKQSAWADPDEEWNDPKAESKKVWWKDSGGDGESGGVVW